MNKVLVVLTCYSRPQNLERLVGAWKEQSISTDVVVVDNRKAMKEQTYYIPEGAKDTWRMTENLGCPCRFYPALALYQYKYAVMADDDLEPGPLAVGNFVGTAIELNDEFSTLGQVGRVIRVREPVGARYSGRTCPTRSSTKPVPVDLTCRVHMIKTADVPHVFTFRANLLAKGGDANRLCGIHEDMLQSFGIQTGTGYPSYLVANVGPNSEPMRTELDTGKDGLWKRPDHFKERNRMVDLCMDAGWSPIAVLPKTNSDRGLLPHQQETY